MAEIEYDNNYATWLTAAGLTPNSNPINLRGVIHQILQNLNSGGGSGTVTSVSVTSGNGLAGTVATATTTPAITLSTSITGVLKGNGTAISAATAGTDYPATGVITAGGPTGSATVVPVITYNANGQLTAVTTATITTPSAYPLSTITADPNPGVVGTYYRFNYASTGNFTLPTTPATGSWIRIKNVTAAAICDVVGTVDGITNFTIPPLGSNTFVYNGTNWDAN